LPSAIAHAILLSRREELGMKCAKAGFAALAFGLAFTLMPAPSSARPLGTVEAMPFYGLPYPNYYVYRPPKMDCYAFQEVWDLLEGQKIVPVYICGEPVRAAY
jgi:hypothetical protein